MNLLAAGTVAAFPRLRKGTLSQEVANQGFELVFDFKVGVFQNATL